MKKLLLIAAVASLATPAFASRARLTALGNAEHLIDTQTVFNNPSHLAWMSDYVTFEGGPSSATNYSGGAEGGFVRSSGDAKYMAYLGRKSEFTTGARAYTGYLGQENPIEIDYAMKGAVNWGVGLNYSSSDKKSSSMKQSAYGVRLGASTDLWEAYAIVGLGSKAEGHGVRDLNLDGDTADAGEAAGSGTYTGTTGFKVGAAYKMENIYAYIKYYQDGYKLDETGLLSDRKHNQSQADIGIVDHNKIDGGQWFYGVAFRIYQSKIEGNTTADAGGLDVKTDTTSLPFLLGVEYDATSWATLRASATQNVLLGSTKADDGTGPRTDETDTIANNTTVAAGVALKFNKWVIDGSWAAGTTGDVNTTNFLTNVALTYSF